MKKGWVTVACGEYLGGGDEQSESGWEVGRAQGEPYSAVLTALDTYTVRHCIQVTSTPTNQAATLSELEPTCQKTNLPLLRTGSRGLGWSMECMLGNQRGDEV